MERNDVTEVGKLTVGDRFYFQNDKKKIVFEVMVILLFKVKYNRINAYGYKMLPHDLDLGKNRNVIFLRHKNQ